MLADLYRYRTYILQTAAADVRHRYAGSTVGVFWNVLQPLAMILVFSIVFGTVFTERGEGLKLPERGGFALYLVSALLPWQAFGECLNRGVRAFIQNAAYLRKLPIPEVVFSAQTAVSAAIGLGLGYSVFVLVAIIVGHGPMWHWVLLPLPMLSLCVLGFGFGLMLGTMNVFIRDIGELIGIVLLVGFWAYPVVYPPWILPQWAQSALPFNPVYPMLTAIRGLFLYGELPGIGLVAGMLVWPVVACGLGWAALRRLGPEIRDVL
jgi:lipopolysaccharide transport system permease protein